MQIRRCKQWNFIKHCSAITEITIAISISILATPEMAFAIAATYTP
ncbi:hypothetical protein [Nostoc sp.]